MALTSSQQPSWMGRGGVADFDARIPTLAYAGGAIVILFIAEVFRRRCDGAIGQEFVRGAAGPPASLRSE
jgi:hypothetical protein